MEDGAKEEPAQCKEPKFLAKAGGLKKATGRVLASYKDRYIHVEKTELVVYENEDRQNCIERLDLENYDKCHELKSTFKKKHRLILIRSPKSGNKVHDIKFQAQSAEEKEAWIKALSDGINRAKNKVFDEVTVDESSNLEHVTRTRPKGNRNRRPPTRIHMKEVADVSSDGITRLDLDLEGASMPNGTHPASVDGTETIQVQKPTSNGSEATEKQSEEEGQNKTEVSPQKKVIKPPMPPTKEAKPPETTEDEPDKDDSPVKKVIKPPMPPTKEAKPPETTEDEPDKDDSPVKKVKPPMPPSKEVKPVVSSVEEVTEKEAETISEKSPDARKKTGPPPTPPNKPSSSLTETSQPRPSSHQPTPPSKEKKPSKDAVEPDQEAQGTTDEDKEKENNKKEPKESAVKTVKAGQSVAEEAQPSVTDDDTDEVSEESGETRSSDVNKSSDNEPQAPPEQLKKSPPPTPMKKPEKLVQPNTQHIEDKTTVKCPTEEQAASETPASSLEADEALPKSEVPSVVVSLSDPVTDSLSLSPLLCHLDGEKKKKSEEKSVDSGQHSDDDSDGSGSEDTLAASTAALRGSHPGLDVLDASEDKTQISVTLRPTQAATKSQVRSKVFPYRRSEHIPSLKPSTKARSASSGDLLSDSSVCVQVRPLPEAVAEKNRDPRDDVTKLEAEVALEMENTNKLLSKVSQSQRGGDGEDMPEDLLAKAMEKLKQADHVLREVKKLKCANNSSNRKSW